MCSNVLTGLKVLFKMCLFHNIWANNLAENKQQAVALIQT